MKEHLTGKRDSNLELLRIIAILLVTLDHIASLGRATGSSLPFNHYLALFYYMWGKIGVNAFVILGCWFLADRPGKASQIIRICFEAFFYGTVLNLIYILFFHQECSFYSIFRGYFYWYVFAYIIMLLLIPLMKKAAWLENKYVLSAMFVLLSVIPTVSRTGMYLPGFLGKIYGCFHSETIIGPFWFCFIFLLTRKFKKEKILDRCGTRLAVGILVLCVAIMYIVTIIINDTYIRDMYSVPCLAASFALFSIFAKRKMGYYAWINRFGAFSFALYLFQAHYGSKTHLWQDILRMEQWSENVWFPLYSILAVILIFMMCAVLELLRQRLHKTEAVQKLENKLGELLTRLRIG